MQIAIWVLISFAMTFILMPQFIKIFQKKKIGQTTREEGPLWHEVKTGTPTMGGTVFVIVAVLTMLLAGVTNQLFTTPFWMIMVTLILFGGIGFVDDFISIFKKQNEGLKAKQKFILQFVFAFLIIFISFSFGETLSIPFFGYEFNNALFVGLFGMVWMNGFSNAVNLTDGLDGLATGLSIFAYLAYAIIAFLQENISVGLACSIVVGALSAFLFYNQKPAKIFMGDVGSLALGATLGVISLILNNPWSLLIIGIVFVIETVSVILQVWSFKTRGKRIFKMSPIHHHFEMSGWSESKVVHIFWLVGLIAAIIYLVINLL